MDFEDGGPAFPQHANTGNLEGWRHGLSLRDYFAGSALIGVASQLNPDHLQELAEGQADAGPEAKAAYALADAMLKAREQ